MRNPRKDRPQRPRCGTLSEGPRERLPTEAPAKLPRRPRQRHLGRQVPGRPSCPFSQPRRRQVHRLPLRPPDWAAGSWVWRRHTAGSRYVRPAKCSRYVAKGTLPPTSVSSAVQGSSHRAGTSPMHTSLASEAATGRALASLRGELRPLVAKWTESGTGLWHPRRHRQSRKQQQPLQQPRHPQHRADPGRPGYEPATPTAKYA